MLQQSLKDLESAFKNFFQQRADFPKFKKKGLKERFRFPQGCKLEQENDRLFLPKSAGFAIAIVVRLSAKSKMLPSAKSAVAFLLVFKLNLSTKSRHIKAVKSVLIWALHVLPRFSNGEFFEPLNAFKTYKGKLAKTPTPTQK